MPNHTTKRKAWWLLLTALLYQLPFGVATELGKNSTQFTIDGKPTFLLGISYYGALGAPTNFIAADLDDIQRDHFNWLRVWATWTSGGENVSAIDTNGAPREPYLTRLEQLIKTCDQRGLIVDVTLSRGATLPNFDAHQKAVRLLTEKLQPYRNWYLDLGNEREVRDARYVRFEELRLLRQLVRQIDPKRLVTASDSSDDQHFTAAIEKYLREVKLDFLTPHRRRAPDSPAQTAEATKLYLAKMESLNLTAPVLFQEPFRRGYTKWEPKTEDFLRDLQGAIDGGAAGWCFHNGSPRDPKSPAPGRSFDLRQKRLYDQLDLTELEVTKKVGSIIEKK
jgi:hypothetical protein